jgi:hypothetical protein
MESEPVAGAPAPGRERVAAVKEFGRSLRRAFEVVRQYKPTHTMAREARDRAIAALLAAVKAQGELELDLTAMSVQYAGVPIEVAKRRTDSISLPLFREGVRRLTFTSEAGAEELVPFFAGWLDAWLNPLSSDGVATRLWEHQPRGIRAVIIDTFELGGEEGGGGGGADGQPSAAAVTVREQVDAILGAIAAESLAGAGGAAAVGVLSISAEDAALLRSEAVRSVTGEQLASHDVAAGNLTGLDDAERVALASELTVAREGAASRFVTALVNAALLAREEDRTRAAGVFASFTLAMVGQGACELPYVLYREQVAGVPRDGALPQLRVALLKRFRDALMSGPVIDALLGALDDAEGHPAALAAFAHLGRACVPLISERLAKLTTPEGRTRALKLLNALEPGSTAMLGQARGADTASLVEALNQSADLAEPARLTLLLRGLSSTDVAVRRLSMRHMTPRLAALLPSNLLNNRLGDVDPGIRASALALALELESPTSVPAIIAGLKRPIELEERLHLYEALSTIGGPGVAEALAAELHTRPDTDTRVAAAKALGLIKEPRAREALAQVAAKLLTPPRLRQACRAALGVVE